MSEAEVVKAAPVQGMLCPVCQVALVMSERQGIEIDYCPKCRGVWLDRGELDKIIARSEEDQQRESEPQALPGQPGAAEPPPSFMPQPGSPWDGAPQRQGQPASAYPQAPPAYPVYPPQGGPGNFDAGHQGHGDDRRGGHGGYGGHGGGGHGGGGFLSRIFR